MARNSEVIGILLILLVASNKGGGMHPGNLMGDVQKLSGILNNMNNLSQLAFSGNLLENMAPLLTLLGNENHNENQNDIF